MNLTTEQQLIPKTLKNPIFLNSLKVEKSALCTIPRDRKDTTIAIVALEIGSKRRD